MKRILAYFSLLFSLVGGLTAQNAPAAEKTPSQFGVRFGYGLEFPSKNYDGALEFSLFEAGHRLSYGAFVNLQAEPNVQFSPYFGLEHVFWPKSESYDRNCERDSFPTFMGIADSVPGRDFRFYNIVLEPAFRFYISKLTVWLKVQPHFAINLRARVENYTHACNSPISQEWLTYEETETRQMSQFNFGLGFGIVKEVMLGGDTGLSLEPGFRFMLSPLLDVDDPDPDGRGFNLYPWGFYLNLSLFR